MANFRPYKGAQRNLVLALDFGTTFSGISFTVLDPGLVPRIHSVTRFPGQENGDFKIPSVICYAQDGRILTVGAEARQDRITMEPGEGEPVFVEWFKLHLCPPSMKPAELDLPPLPAGKTVVEVIADFFKYLFKCTQEFIHQSLPNGASVWTSVGDRIEVIVSHPNGWQGSQQARMRDAAILAGLIPNTAAGRARLHFVTEGEASLHYCVNSGLISESIKGGLSVMIVDAGGGTVDLTTYKFVTADPIAVEEIVTPECILQGSTQVNSRFQAYLEKRLVGSEFCGKDDIDTMLQVFERSTKPTFKNPAVRSFIKFGRLRDKDGNVGIRNGSLAVEGEVLVDLFEPAVDGVVNAVRRQRKASSAPVNRVFLVGGFAASPWLYTKICEAVKDDGAEVSRPDGHTNKVVSEGAVTWFLKMYVTTRIARMTWGFPCAQVYDADNPRHYERRDMVYVDLAGDRLLSGIFNRYISEGARLTENVVVRHSWAKISSKLEAMDSVSIDVQCYRGTDPSPYWIKDEPESYWSLYTVRGDTSGIYKYKGVGPKGTYYGITFDVVLTVGLTTLQAYISWTENGKEKRGEAEILYEESQGYLLT